MKTDVTTMATATTPTDEAFALLILENCYKRWVDQGQENDLTYKSAVEALYTRGKATGRNRRYEGWSKEGIQRFNELIGLVKTDRDDHADWDRNYLQKQQQQAGSGSKKRKSRTAPEPMPDAGMDDLFSGETAV
jgi:hypothetical protein